MDEIDQKPFLNDRTGVSVSKIRDILRRQRQESDGGTSGEEVSDLDFVYDDADTYSIEMSELYSYTEVPEFRRNLTSFETLLTEWGFSPRWQQFNSQAQESIILRLLNHLELSQKEARNEAARAMLYISQVAGRE